MKLAVPDLISNSYFPAIAACELGLFASEGLDVSYELIFPVDRAYEALRGGAVDFVAGSAHSAVSAFPEWEGVQLLCAQGQGMYWFLVLRSDLGARRGDLRALAGLRIGAAPWVEMGLRRILTESGVDLARDSVEIVRVPGALSGEINFGLTAARALANRTIDGFWANGMAAAIAVRDGTGVVVLDTRRGDGPRGCFNYTMASLAAHRNLIETSPEIAAAAIRAMVRTHKALKADVTLARRVGVKVFPSSQAELIVELIRRDLPYYDASVTRASVDGMLRFSRDVGILKSDLGYDTVVATQFCNLWDSPV